MKLGTPVLCNNVDAMNEYFVDPGLAKGFEKGSNKTEKTNNLTKGIEEFLEKPGEYMKRAEKAKIVADEIFSWEKVAKMYLDAYDSITK
jgi:glycosyltransferase involved in cell wall biosynthesis